MGAYWGFMSVRGLYTEPQSKHFRPNTEKSNTTKITFYTNLEYGIEIIYKVGICSQVCFGLQINSFYTQAPCYNGSRISSNETLVTLVENNFI